MKAAMQLAIIMQFSLLVLVLGIIFATIHRAIVIQAALAVALAGVLLAEFTGMGGGFCSIAEPFSQVRNEAAIAFGLAGLLIGAVIGEVGRRAARH